MPTDAEVQAFLSLISITSLAKFLGTTTARLNFNLYSPRRPLYIVFGIPKAAGGVRQIEAPPALIRAFQRKILKCMSASVRPKRHAHAFTVDRSVVSNARDHVGSRLVLTFDLLDFFPTIHFGRVRGVFEKEPFKFPRPLASVLAQLCCNKGRLPQGAPTSPLMSNLICRRLDRDLAKLASRSRCKYSRYADDITFSTSLNAFPAGVLSHVDSSELVLGDELTAILGAHSFEPNPKKTRVRSLRERQEVTGIVVNSRLNLERSYIRNVRATINNCRRNGIAVEEERFKAGAGTTSRDSKPPLVAHLHGKLNYFLMVRGQGDRLWAKYAIELEKLMGSRRFGISLAGEAACDHTLRQEAIWVVEGLDKEGVMLRNGTAFSLNRVGIVTAAHVFDESEEDHDSRAARWVVRRASEPTRMYEVRSKRIDRHLDLAILDTNAPQFASLSAREAGPLAGEEIIISGFPNWHTTADRMSSIPAHVTQTKTVSMVDYVLTTAPIKPGLSGGPILGKDGLVIGVIRYGSTGTIAPDSGVHIRHVLDFGGAEARALPSPE